jgi:hypothetical protein
MTRFSPPSFAPGGRHLPVIAGGLTALVLPVALSVPAIRALLAGEDVLEAPTAPLLSGVLFLVAAPTLWLWALLDLSPAVTVALAALTSFPLWFAVGAWLAGRARRWRDWWARYLTVALVWTLGFLLVLAAVATLSG